MTSPITLLILCSLGQPGVPQGPQPRFAIVHEIDKDKREISYMQIETVAEIVAVKTIENGLEVIRKEIRQVRRTVPGLFSFNRGTVQDAAGKKVPMDEVWKRLKKGATVLFSSQPIDPLYLRIVQPETLILITSPPVPLPKLPRPKV